MLNLDSVSNHNDLVLIGNWLLLKPAGYNCPSEDLEKEVIQLGLPQEHGTQLRKVYESYKEELKEKVRNNMHKEPHGTVVDSSPTSLTFQSGSQVYDVSMNGNMMNQFKTDIENSLSQMKELAGTLPNNLT
uniref:LEM domain-containing protein n=1 Tax=Caenorhabditis tropicalis TaxID=1561998 RepID=A0A1I7TKC1_9PELO